MSEHIIVTFIQTPYIILYRFLGAQLKFSITELLLMEDGEIAMRDVLAQVIYFL